MKPLFFLSIAAISLVSCDEDTVTTSELPSNKQLDFTEFTIDVPATWTGINMQGIDSYIGGINMEAEQEATFDLGWYSNSLDVDSLQHRFEYITIDGKQAKLVYPVNAGRGTTGVFISNLNDGGLIRFELHGEDLTAENQQMLMDAIHTLDFK